MAILFPVKSEMAILFFVKRDPGPPFTTLLTGGLNPFPFQVVSGNSLYAFVKDILRKKPWGN